jgi:C4-type Zn-finger protein
MLMLVQLLNPEIRSFGINDRPLCPQCGQHMDLTRRSPNGPLDPSAEFQTFTCIECDFEATRIVDMEGKPA